MSLQPRHRVLCSGTRQCTPFRERLAPARAAGFTAVSVWANDVARQDLGELRAEVEGHGLVVAEAEVISNWLPQHAAASGPFAEITRALTPAKVIGMATGLGAPQVSLAELHGVAASPAELAPHFAEVCARAAGHGLKVAIEFVPTGAIPTLAVALELIERAGAGNAGLMVDPWHFFRGGSSLDQLARVPGELILSIQLDDAPAMPTADPYTDMMVRDLPGEGGLDLAGFMAALAATGTSAPVGIEVFSAALDALPTAQAFARCAAGLDHCLNLARKGPA
ncbi:MAG: sugar phosphate isomerase/epimerase [Proteobacteria bacterium]|nr:sugar phosphate isomerase/epimerase [Pseudomonadota bacterium]